MLQRRDVRELLLKALYAEEVSGNEWSHIINSIIKPAFKGDKKNYRFGERLFYETLNNGETIDELIANNINNWHISRINLTDKIILRLAISEFLYFETIPTKVTINEALELAKKYSTKKSSNFVNGILDAVLEQLKKEDRITKKGRGLIETSINGA